MLSEVKVMKNRVQPHFFNIKTMYNSKFFNNKIKKENQIRIMKIFKVSTIMIKLIKKIRNITLQYKINVKKTFNINFFYIQIFSLHLHKRTAPRQEIYQHFLILKFLKK